MNTETSMDTADDFQETIESSHKIQENENIIIEYKHQIKELNKKNKLLLIHLLYGSIVVYFYKTVVLDTLSVVQNYVSPEITGQVDLLHEKIEIEYNKYITEAVGGEEITEPVDILFNDLLVFQGSMEYFFNEFIKYNIIHTDETTLVPYLQKLFYSEPVRFKQLTDLIEKKTQYDDAIEGLSLNIYTMEEKNIILDNPQQLTPNQLRTKIGEDTSNIREKTNHLFLLVCHGSSVSQFKNYFKTRSYFKNIEFIAPFGEKLYSDLGILEYNIKKSWHQNTHSPEPQIDVDVFLDEYRKTVGDEKYRSNEVIISENQYAYLPPMVFTPVTEDPDQSKVNEYNKVMGLYHYAFVEGTYYLMNIVEDYDGLMKKIVGKFLTYSSISSITRQYFNDIKNGVRELHETFNVVQEHIKTTSETELFETSSITFFSCRYYLYDDMILDKDILRFFNSSIVVFQEPEKARFFDGFDIVRGDNVNDKVSLLTIDLKFIDIIATIQRWQGALVSLYHQGCGVNILNFYGLMNTAEARSRASCVNIGTSIFKIADFIANNSPQYSPNQGFGVCRMPLDRYISLISNIMNNNVRQLSMATTFVNTNYLADMAFIFRIYESDFQKDGKTYNEVGHFVSVCVKDDMIYFIDPQQSILELSNYYIEFTTNNYIYEFLRGVLLKHYSNYNFCDFYIYKNNISPLTLSELETDYGGVLRKRPEKLSFGGKRKHAKQTTKRIIIKQKAHNKYRNKNKKTKKVRKNTKKQKD
jgi:hypothetical protein